MSKEQAIELFTDRTEPQKAFANQYLAMAQATPGSRPSRVLTYYGIGGIGKSTLLTKLGDNLERDPALSRACGNKPLSILFNFENKQEDVKVLMALRNLLNKQYGWKFPRFEVGLYLYSQSIGEDADAPEEGSYLDRSSSVKFAVDIASELPIVGSVLKVLSLVDQGQAALRSLLKQHSALVRELEALTAEEQRERLPALFAQDLNLHTQKAAAPLVVMLDTFECVTETASLTDSYMGRDYWLYNEEGLIPQAQNTLFVIAGRNKIPWQDTPFYLEQHLLGSLSPEDAGSFLTAAGIPKELTEPLCKLTDGVPVYLDVCVQQYNQLLKKGIAPESSHFGGSQQKLIQRYVRYMDKSEKELVHMLSFLPEWDKALVKKASEAVFKRFSYADYSRIVKLSITTEAENGRYFLHRTVAEILRNDPDNDLCEDTAEFMIAHYKGLLGSASPYSDEYADAAEYLLLAGILRNTGRDDLAAFYREHVEDPVDMLNRCRRKDRAQRIVERLWVKAQEEKDDWLYALALQETAWRAYQRSGLDYKMMLQGIEALKLYIALKGEEDFETLRVLSMVAIFMAQSHHDKEAVPMYEYLIEQLQKHHPDSHNMILNAKRNMALSYRALRLQDKKTALLEEVLEGYRAKLGKTHRGTIRALRDLAVAYREQSRYDEAIPFAAEALEICRGSLKENDPETLNAIITLAFTYSKKEDYENAIPLYRELVDLRTALLGEDHADTISALTELGNCYTMQDDHQKAMATREEVVRLRKLTNDPKYQTSLSVLVQSCWNAGAYERAAQLVEERLADLQAKTDQETETTIQLRAKLFDCNVKLDRQEQNDKMLAMLTDKLAQRDAKSADYFRILDFLVWARERLGEQAQAFEMKVQAMDERLNTFGVYQKELPSRFRELLLQLKERGMTERIIRLCRSYLSYVGIGGNRNERIFAEVELAKACHQADPQTSLTKRYLKIFPLYEGGRHRVSDVIELGKYLLYREKDTANGRAVIEPAAAYIREHQADDPYGRSALAQCCKLLGRYEEALTLLRQLRQEAKENTRSHMSIEIESEMIPLLERLGHTQEAQQMKEAVDARRLRPATAEQAPSYKGLSLTQMLEAAEKLYEQATESLMPYSLRREKQRSRVMQETLDVKNPRRIDDMAKLLKQFN